MIIKDFVEFVSVAGWQELTGDPARQEEFKAWAWDKLTDEEIELIKNAVGLVAPTAQPPRTQMTKSE